MPDATDLLLVKSGGASVFHEWIDGFAACCPGLTVKEWDDTSVRDDEVTYVLVGQSAHGLLRDWRRLALAQEQRRWDHFLGRRTARDTRVGVLGLGHIGLTAARMLGGLGFPVHGWSRSAKRIDGVTSYAGMAQLRACLEASDIVVGLLPHTNETMRLIRAETIGWMPHGAGLVSGGRGSLVNLPDLLAALDSGRLGGAVLDVFEQEPLPPDHPAWVHPRLTVTSHVAGFATRRVRAAYVAEAMAVLEQGGTPLYLYQHERGY